ncbi:DUF192 domain-containing protein [Halorubrum sp. GN11_10-6_MGM]|uniref:DUF192 domain-containing protein n=1 Tax=Halorubrum sp. GN11_10-6_MGM TaxID=2518112 RepID=UPI0010F705DE|nr:DUF192 domain-containing protein [Halorubrum sp. GN11_10-6_MGM]TKX75471.1 DUF192 domain-containing protein [Halorubrum sp. GN11_10-6_MGM]
MDRRRLLGLTAAAAAGVSAGCLGDGDAADDGDAGDADSGDADRSGNGGADGDAASAWPSEPYADYETTTVTVSGPDGESRGTVTAAIADDRDKRFLGLSDAESLPEDAGMLFVYDAPRDSLTYVMRRMSFGIDIVYVDGDREVVRIHNAPEPGPNEDGEEQRYPGSGQYVLEVPFEWTDRHGVEVGDRLAFDL